MDISKIIGFTLICGAVLLFMVFLIGGIPYLFEILCKERLKSKVYSAISRTGGIFLFLIILTTPLIALYLSNQLGCLPPFIVQSRGQLLTQKDASTRLTAIATEAERIKNTLSHIEALSIHDIQTQLTTVIGFLEILQKEKIEQERVVSELINKTNEQSQKYKTSKQIAESVQSLTQEQINTVSLLVTQNSKEESSRSFFIGVLISFPVGIITSLIASFFYGLFKRGELMKKTSFK